LLLKIETSDVAILASLITIFEKVQVQIVAMFWMPTAMFWMPHCFVTGHDFSRAAKIA
jgi:hypothetical protein